MKTILCVPYIFIIMMIYSCSSKPNEQQVKVPIEQSPVEQKFFADTTTFVDTNSNKTNVPQQIGNVPVYDETNKEIIHFRVQNTYNNSDKTHACYIIIDEQSKVLTLKALNDVDVFTLTSEGGSAFTLNYYNNDGLQATKTVYRRYDLEVDGNEAQIYTSRTGEITLTLFYP